MFDDLKKSLLCLVGGKSLTMRKYLDKPDLAQDSGTHEGAIKAARTRKLHGGMNYYIDDEIIDNGHDSGFAGDDDHNTEDRGHIKRWLWGPRWRKTWKDVPENLHPVSELLSKRQFPIGVRDDFLNFARGYSGNAEDVKTPIELSSKGYRVAHGKRRGELKLIKIDDLGGIDMKYSWRPKNPNKLRTSSVRRSSIPRFVSHSDEDLAERKRIGLVDKTMPTEEQISAMPKAARTAWENERKYAKVPYINYGRMPGMANTGIEPEDEERYHLYRRQEDSACDSSPNAFERYMTKAKDSGANDRETNCVIPIFNSKTIRKYLGEATDDLDEAKHPRGNENNAGQFAKKGEQTQSGSENTSVKGGVKELSSGSSTQSKSHSYVTPDEDAAYKSVTDRIVAATKSGKQPDAKDIEEASKMVRMAAAKAMPDTKVVDADGLPLVVYHTGTFGNETTTPSIQKEGMHFGTLKAAKAR